MNRVVVTGLGCITPIGNTVEDFRTSLFAGQTGIAPFPPYPESPRRPKTRASALPNPPP